MIVEFDGEEYEFPDDATDDEITAALSGAPTAEAPSGFLRGLRDPIDAGAQLLTKALPEPVVEAGNRFNNWLIEQGMPLAPIGAGGLDEQLQQQESAYQAQRAAAGETGIDWSRIGGNIASPVNLALAAKIPQAASAAGKLGTAAAAGGGFGALQPVYQGDFATEKAKQVGGGAMAGFGTQLGLGALGRMIRPKSSPQAQQLLREGVTPTPGKLMGPFAARAEEKLTSLPLTGDAMIAAQQSSIEDFSKAALNRALAPLGESLPKGIPAGRQAFRHVRDRVRNAYHTLLPKMRGEIDETLRAEMINLHRMGKSMGPGRGQQLDEIIDRQVRGRFTQHGKASGETVKAIDTELGRLARQYRTSMSGDERQLGQAVLELQESIRRMMERVNPDYAGELKAANQAWGNYVVLRNASSRIGSKEGIITPATLTNAVRGTDSSYGKTAFASGQARMQDLAEAGQSIIGNKYPDSGTAGRLFLGGGALAGGMFEPTYLAASALAAAPYLLRRASAAALAKRPPQADAIAEALRRTSPFLLPGTAPLGYGLLNQ